ncbi:chromatin modification-related protein EAF7 isoform X2 [Raphanus sativus]|uniref:Chromatin modification-related protein EAF7 isoform X2 n=1 Tax=Raphanus sativus TaxID=3726 RepID=A0A6J0KBD5_RAPSA|nr:chromatin modification-related protein EAF7 isoform X2 [Raphanus sativus]
MALPGEEPEFMNLREWDRRARFIRENPTSRRFSASYVGSFREDCHKSSSRTNVNNISSTASSPGYTLKEIDPSTYSFTNALKALQAKTMYNKIEWLTQEGFALNSKWNEAEKYICNPLSGEVPMECLSSKTLRARSFRNLTTMSAPLHYPKPNPLTKIDQNKTNNNNHNVRVIHEDLYVLDPVLVRAEEKVVGLKLDVGIKSTSVDSSSGSPSPAETPPIMERSLKRYAEAYDSPVDFNLNMEGQPEDLKLTEDEKEEEKHEMPKKEEEEEEEEKEKQGMSKKEEEKQELIKGKGEKEQETSEEGEKQMEKNKKRGSGCFPWMRSRQGQARKSKYIFPICIPHLVKGC